MLAFRMMVKDLLVLFQAGNEGIINLLGPSSFGRVARDALIDKATLTFFRSPPPLRALL